MAHIPHICGPGGYQPVLDHLVKDYVAQELTVSVHAVLLLHDTAVPVQNIGIGLCHFFSKGVVLRGEPGCAGVLIGLKHHLLQHIVGHDLAAAGEELDVKCGLSHQGCAPGAVAQPAVYLVHVPPLGGPDVVPHRALVRHYVGGAGADGCVVDAHVRLHMLPHVVGGHVHQLHRVQGAPTVEGVAGGMGGLAVEVKLHRVHAGVAGSPGPVVGVGVPGHGAVHALKGAVPDHEHLAYQGLLRRAAIEADRPLGPAGGNGVLQGQRRAHRAHAQVVVAAAVAGALRLVRILELLVVRHLLVETGQGVVLPQVGNDRAAGAVLGADGRGDGAHPQLHPEALGLQEFGNGPGGLHLLQAGLRILPDLPGQGGKGLLPGIHGGKNLFFLISDHQATPFSSKTVQ